MDEETLEPTLQALVEHKELKWIFVGGKGGVGKTTTSCCLALQLAKVRENVLIISTDPAHNLSDAFKQKFSKKPTLVGGFENLYAMEVDPNMDTEMGNMFAGAAGGASGPLGESAGLIKELTTAIPGIDEAMSFAEVMRLVQTMEFSAIVFDTAPTGHTLRLLSFPSLLEKGLGKLSALKSRFGGLFQQMSSMFGMPQEQTEGEMQNRLEQTQKIIEEVNVQFKNPDLTTFVCVCIPEFLSLYETERLVQELTKFEMDTQNIVVNQVLYPTPGSDCRLCIARQKMQQKYISQIEELYEDFHVVKMPLLPSEVRGTDALKAFSDMLVKPFDTSTDVTTANPIAPASSTTSS
eukprot:TRINITY_DN20777_c0_g1_i1.p1 TRINITY_DN20777_c0_g1~~TRINITY_DN20777_c0_g1_i1.p1  ORF type:complete len:350 (+),score=130.31 TRINITY_DN20777_c0_g1_i1:53-1102(+)